MKRLRYRRAIGVGVASVALGVTAFATVGAQADQGASSADRAKTATVSMEAQGKRLFFDGPKSVKRGAELQIKNDTDPSKIGPHTFTLVKKPLLPEISKKGIKDCFKDGVCVQIAKAHDVDFKAETIGKNLVRAGKNGWDKSFGKRGDSRALLREGDTFSQKVKAKPGKTLYYMCLVHPEMQGKIKVK